MANLTILNIYLSIGLVLYLLSMLFKDEEDDKLLVLIPISHRVLLVMLFSIMWLPAVVYSIVERKN